jgi:hypothetical protein
MREIYVVEVKDALGNFQPQVGFGDPARVDEWMEKFLPIEVRLQTEQWRIVRYVPQVIGIDEAPLIH